jgi:hypothetical protein
MGYGGGNFIGVNAVHRAAVVAEPLQRALQGSNISRLPDQIFASL